MKKAPPTAPRTWLDILALGVASLGPAGLAPKAPGTVGSAVAVLLAPWCFLPWSMPIRVVLLIILFFLGALAATRAERLLGREDPSSVVVDELVGQWLVLLPLTLPFASGVVPGPVWNGAPILLLLAAFGLFRLFDIAKPWPVSASEHWLPAGYGIMIDDVVAGLIGMACFIGLLIAIAFAH